MEDNHGRGAHIEHSAELESILGSYRMTGCPINQSYTGLEPLVEAVHATRVHINDTNDVEFALAVHVHPYPNNVISVWVYIASLIRK